jgi:hypothetical protein
MDVEIAKLGVLVSENDQPVQPPLPRYATGFTKRTRASIFGRKRTRPKPSLSARRRTLRRHVIVRRGRRRIQRRRRRGQQRCCVSLCNMPMLVSPAKIWSRYGSLTNAGVLSVLHSCRVPSLGSVPSSCSPILFFTTTPAERRELAPAGTSERRELHPSRLLRRH